MASKPEPGPSTSVANSNVGIINTGSGSVIVYSLTPKDDFPLPQRIKTFHGREVEMRELKETFFTQDKHKAVICGLGGFGKTELVKQFAQLCLEEGKIQKVSWIPAECPDKLKKSYEKLIIIYKTCTDKHLFIFDNCVNQKSITDYEPTESKNNYILITSHDKQWGSDVKIIELQPLSTDSSTEVFKSVLGNKYEEEDKYLYKIIADLVGNIPLGLQILACNIAQEDEDFILQEYVDEIMNSQISITDEIPGSAKNSYDKSIYGATIKSLEKIKDKKSDVAITQPSAISRL